MWPCFPEIRKPSEELSVAKVPLPFLPCLYIINANLTQIPLRTESLGLAGIPAAVNIFLAVSIGIFSF